MSDSEFYQPMRNNAPSSKSTLLVFRAPVALRNRFLKQAAAEGDTLSAWIRRHLSARVGAAATKRQGRTLATQTVARRKA